MAEEPALSIDNPILNSPYEQPDRYYEIGPQGPTGKIRDGRRSSESFIPIAMTKKLDAAALAPTAGDWTEPNRHRRYHAEQRWLPPIRPCRSRSARTRLGDGMDRKGNRENQTLPVLELRESAQKAGLRKYRGRLLLRLRGAPCAMILSRRGGGTLRRHRPALPMPARRRPVSFSWSRPPLRSRTT